MLYQSGYLTIKGYDPDFEMYKLAYPNGEVRKGLEEALAQIDSKQYTIPYQSDGKRIIKVGVNFDSITRTIGAWKID